jgi:hypothetical protein
MFLLPAALMGVGVTIVPATVTSTFATYVLVGIDEIGLESKFIVQDIQSIQNKKNREYFPNTHSIFATQ